MKREKSLKKVKIFEKRVKNHPPRRKNGHQAWSPCVAVDRRRRPGRTLGAKNWAPGGGRSPPPAELSQVQNDGKPAAEDDERQRRAEGLS